VNKIDNIPSARDNMYILTILLRNFYHILYFKISDILLKYDENIMSSKDSAVPVGGPNGHEDDLNSKPNSNINVQKTPVSLLQVI